MTKRTMIPLLIAALVALLPWLAVTFAKGDNGMAVIFLLFCPPAARADKEDMEWTTKEAAESI